MLRLKEILETSIKVYAVISFSRRPRDCSKNSVPTHKS